MNSYLKSFLLLNENDYQVWSEENNDKQFFHRDSPFNYFSSSKEDLALVLNPLCGILNLDVVFLQASLFKSKELVFVLNRFIFFHPDAKLIIYFDKDVDNNQLLLHKLTEKGCEILFDPKDWIPFHEMFFIPNRPEYMLPEPEEQPKTFLFWKKISHTKRIRKRQKKITADYQLY